MTTEAKGFLIHKNRKLIDVIKSLGSNAHGYSESDYYYLPFYFEITKDGKIIMHHINGMPDELKEAILDERKNENDGKI